MPPQIGNCVPIWEDLIPKVRFEGDARDYKQKNVFGINLTDTRSSIQYKDIARLCDCHFGTALTKLRGECKWREIQRGVGPADCFNRSRTSCSGT
jgi:hypothetical protein